MKNKLSRLAMPVVLLFFLVLTGPFSNAKVLIEDVGTTKTSRWPDKIAGGADDFKKLRRAGLGVVVSGAYGLLGTQIDLNLAIDTSFHIGIGGGPGYQSTAAELRRYFEGQWFQPYLGLGYARWASYSERGTISKSTPSFLSERFLNDSERATGKFTKDILFPAFGVEYFQLSGPFAGFAIFAEISILSDVGDFQFVPTGSLGTSYYF